VEMVMVLSEGDRKFLLQDAAVRHYGRGHNLFNQGDDATCLFVVLEGEVEMFVVNGEARTIIDRRESGALCGELELLGGQHRIASAVTLRARPEIIESTFDRVNIEFTTDFSYHIWWS